MAGTKGMTMANIERAVYKVLDLPFKLAAHGLLRDLEQMQAQRRRRK